MDKLEYVHKDWNERGEWHDALLFVPAHPGLYEASYEIRGAFVRYTTLYLWTGKRWLHPNLNHQTIFPQPGDHFRGLKFKDRRAEFRKT